jgi:stringent starvation protein B
MNKSSSTKPYLLRALFDWCVDNSLTPYVVVQVDERTRVPMAYVRDGQIVLNIAPYATNQLSITHEDISCQARFNGVAQSLYIPIDNVIAIYARETGQGMAFEAGLGSGSAMELGGASEEGDDPDSGEQESPTPLMDVSSSTATPEDEKPEPPEPPRPSHLRVIK